MAQGSMKFLMTEKLGKQDGPKNRRSSTGKLKSSDSKQIPNYLRASTGSCHDFCKYGRLHDFEAKAKNPILRSTAPKNNCHRPLQSVVAADGKKTTVAKLKHSPDFRSPLPVSYEGSLPSRKEVAPKSASPNYWETSSSSKCAVSLKPKPKTRVPSSSADATEGLNSKRNSDVKIGQKKRISRVEKKASAPLVAALSCKPSLNRGVSMTKHRSLKGATPLKNQKLLKKDEPKQFAKDMDKGASGVVKNLEVDLPLKSQNRKAKPNNEENLLHVVKVETGNKSSGPHQNENPRARLSSPLLSPKSSLHPNSPFLSSHEEDEQDSEYTVTKADDYTSEDDETANFNTVETSVLEYWPRKAGMSLSEDKDSTPANLEFRRGIVIDLHSESNGPKRLRFRQARTLMDNQNVSGSAGRRAYKKRVMVDGQRRGDSSSEKVVLRHKDAEEKKDAQGLFNNVIEETASKLVETRKSKVKALVGAFETVISLQDGNKSPPINFVS